MDPNLELDLDLDAIMREFSDHPAEPPAPPVQEEVTGDTIRLDQVRQAVAAQTAPGLGDTAVFGPMRIEDEPEEEAPPPPPAEPEVEPFSEDWEPEYEEPMGDYPVSDPIPFRPKSRLKELREKLVAGPEKMYYTLLEIGLGKTQLSMALCLAIFLLTAGSTVLYAWGLIGQERIRLLVFIQFLGLLLSGLLGCYRLLEGLGDLLRLRFSANTLLCFTFLVCCIDGVLCLQELRIGVSAAFCLEMFLSMWATYDRRSAELGMTDTMRRATTLDSVVKVPDWYEGRPGYLIGQGEVEHFMDNYAAPSAPERVLDWYSFAVLLCGIAIGVMAGIRHGFSMAIQLCCASLLVGLPATAFLAVVRPLAVLEKQLHKLGTVLCGWKGISTVERQASFPLSDADLFPNGSAKLNGVKFYGDRSPDQVVAYATALIRQGGGAPVALFGQLLESRGGVHYTVTDLHLYPSGIAGEIEGESVLVGTLDLMHDMGVDMGGGTKVNQAVYCAIGSELVGVFAITYQRARSSAAGLRTLCGYSGLAPVSLCEDFMVTESFLRGKFGVNTRRMLFPGWEQKLELLEKEVPEDAPVIALTTKEGLAPKAFAITGARVLRSAMQVGVAIAMTGGILGLLIMAALAWVGGVDWLTPMNILLYQLIWMIPGLLVTEWTRTI